MLKVGETLPKTTEGCVLKLLWSEKGPGAEQLRLNGREESGGKLNQCVQTDEGLRV